MSSMEEIRSRKLQPIYNALETGNWRQAVRLCEKRDVEKWQISKALKANGLWRLGKYDEGLQLCLEVQGASPTDEDTLAAMSYNYRMMSRRELVAPMFEAAVSAKPGDSSLLKELFMCYVRAKHYLKAQQTATKLYKANAQGGKFIIWAAATMLIQAERKDSSAGVMTLPLAEKMTVKVLQEKAASGSRPVGEELRLYLDILKLQGKHREALEALEQFEPASSAPVDAAGIAADENRGTIEDESSLENGTIVNMQELERLELKAELYEKLGGAEDLERAEEVVQGLVRRSPDQWSYYVSLLDLLDKRSGLSEAAAAAASEGGRSPEWPASLTATLELIRNLQREHPKWRGPFLAEMEVFRRAIAWFGSDFIPRDCQGEDGVTAPLSGDGGGEAEDGMSMLWGLLCRCISRYMGLFSSKLCCFRDLRPHLALFATGDDKSPSSGAARGLAWLKAFFRKEAAGSKVVVGADANSGGEREPLGQEQRDIGVKRLHRYICACNSRHLLGDYTSSSSGGDPAEGNNDRELQDGHGKSNGAEACAVRDAEVRYREVVRELTTQYRATLHLNLGSEGGQREVQHGDELVLLAAQTLLRLCKLYDGAGSATPGGDAVEDVGGDQSGKVKGYLGRVEVACLLEASMSCSPYNQHLKILAIDVYRQLGSFARGLTIFGELDVKQIQMDTLSYLVLGPSHSHGLFGEVQGQCRGIAAVHRSCKNDTAEHVARAFDRGNYSKGAEVDRFQREKLELSLQLAMAKAEKVTMGIILDHQSYASAARFLQEEAMPDRGGGATFPGDAWLKGLKENMDYSVQMNRCVAVSKAEEAAVEEARRRGLEASLKRRLLANETLLLALKGDPPARVDGKAKELEAAVSGSRCFLPWKLLADSSRALALSHSGLSKEREEGAAESVLREAADAITSAGASAKSCRELLAACPRHVLALDNSKDGTDGEGGGGKVYQAETPLRSEWIGSVSKTITGGLVYTAVILQALGVELPPDSKKRKSGKGKSKGKGKKAEAAGGGGGAGGAGGARSKLQDALSAFGWEVSELFRAMAASLKSEVSAKGDPARPGETLSRLLKGELGAGYEAAIGILWETDEGVGWCEKGVIPQTVVGVTGSQAICCQRLLSVVTENLAMLQRWEKKGV
ncbi:unnamed protein product [Pylaiella littoralis]